MNSILKIAFTIAFPAVLFLSPASARNTDKYHLQQGSANASSFVKTGNEASRKDLSAVRNDLILTYHKEITPQELSRLYVQCGNSWGNTAFALALAKTTGRDLTSLVVMFDKDLRNWDLTTRRLDLVNRDGTYIYQLRILLNRQISVWNKILSDRY